MEIRKVQKFGDSNVIAIPPKFLNHLHMHRSDYVEVYLCKKNTIIIKKFSTTSGILDPHPDEIQDVMPVEYPTQPLPYPTEAPRMINK